MADYRTNQYRAAFRATLHPDYAHLTSRQTDALLAQVLRDMPPPEADAYLAELSNWLQHAHSLAHRPAAAPAGCPAPDAQQAAARPAAGRLLGLLRNPHLSRALLGQVNGAVGRPAVPVQAGGHEWPVAFGSLLNALLHLTYQAVLEAGPLAAGHAAYVVDREGIYTYDPVPPTQRAEEVLALLAQDYAERFPAGDPEANDDAESFDPVAEWLPAAEQVRR